MSDLPYALRTLARTPGFTAIAVVVLALGIGAATAGFSVANWVLWRPVPGIKDDGRLATVWIGHRDGSTGFQAAGLSYPNYADLRRSVTALSGLASYQQGLVALATEGAAARHVEAEFVMPGYFDVLDAALERGRMFSVDEDRPPNGTPVAVISDRLWASVFNRDPAALGRTLRLNGRVFSVIGIAATSFHGLNRLGNVDLWLPASTELFIRHLHRAGGSERAMGRLLYFVARLAPGATFEQAQAQLSAGARHLAQLYPDVNKEWAGETGAVLFPGVGTNALARPHLAATMRLLVGITVLVLLTACANVANLLLFRGSAARGDSALRQALGAGMGRLVRQQVTGSILLALAGGAVGVLFSALVVELFKGARLLGIEVRDISIDWRVLAFACGASLFTGIVAGFVPAFSAGRADPLPLLKGAGPTETGHRAPLRRALAVTQLALGVALLVGALLFTRTLQRLAAVDLGFDPTGVTTFSVNPDEQGYSGDSTRMYWAQFTRRLRETPGVETVALATTVPFSGMTWGARIRAVGTSDPPSYVDQILVTPAYFTTLRIPVIHGSGFGGSDSSQDVVGLSETLAKRLFGAADPIGRFVEFTPGRRQRVVGVMGDSRSLGLEGDPGPMVYRPLVDLEMQPVMMVRSVLSDREIGATIGRIAAELDSSLPVYEVKSLTDLVAGYLSERRLLTRVFSLLALIALGLAAAGVYGLVGFGVALRTREFGIRTALGAEPGRILRLVLREAALLATLGAALGLSGAALGARVIQSRLYGVGALDLMSYAGAAAMLGLVALVATFPPARMATKVDPVKALRYE
jgi:putative ABC transport system permease protein